ncbi:beta family protein [Salmonella enterica subsp. enterica serovar Montevideo]
MMIKNAASGDIAGMGSPAKWISVRVNLHITKQIDLSEALKTDYDPEEDFF